MFVLFKFRQFFGHFFFSNFGNEIENEKREIHTLYGNRGNYFISFFNLAFCVIVKKKFKNFIFFLYFFVFYYSYLVCLCSLLFCHI